RRTGSEPGSVLRLGLDRASRRTLWSHHARGCAPECTPAWWTSVGRDRGRRAFADVRRAATARLRLVLLEGLRPSNSPTRALARRFAGALRSRGSLATLARGLQAALYSK